MGNNNLEWKKEFRDKFCEYPAYGTGIPYLKAPEHALEIESFISSLLTQQRQRNFEEAASYLDNLAKNEYGEEFFPPIPEEDRAKGGKAADVLRRMLPRYAQFLRSLSNEEGV